MAIKHEEIIKQLIDGVCLLRHCDLITKLYALDTNNTAAADIPNADRLESRSQIFAFYG